MPNTEIKQLTAEKEKLEQSLKTLKRLDSSIRLYFITKALFDGMFPGATKEAILNLIQESSKAHGCSNLQIVPGMIWLSFPDKGIQKEYTESNYRQGGRVITKLVDGKWVKASKNLIQRAMERKK